MDCERERRTVETTKNQMHEELLRNMARQKARQEFELERERKIKEMQMLTETMSDEGIAMAETNDKLNHVHADLKNAFKMMRVSYYLTRTGKLAVCSVTVFTTKGRKLARKPKKKTWFLSLGSLIIVNRDAVLLDNRGNVARVRFHPLR